MQTDPKSFDVSKVEGCLSESLGGRQGYSRLLLFCLPASEALASTKALLEPTET